MSEYVVEVVFEDELGGGPRRRMITDDPFKWESEAREFAEMFNSWIPTQSVNVREVRD